MFTIQIPVNIFLLAGALLTSLTIGYLFRRSQLQALKKKTTELEKELLSCHADILELQKEKTTLEQKVKEYSSSPVIPITISTEEKKAEKISDVSMRKKLLTKKSAE